MRSKASLRAWGAELATFIAAVAPASVILGAEVIKVKPCHDPAPPLSHAVPRIRRRPARSENAADHTAFGHRTISPREALGKTRRGGTSLSPTGRTRRKKGRSRLRDAHAKYPAGVRFSCPGLRREGARQGSAAWLDFTAFSFRSRGGILAPCLTRTSLPMLTIAYRRPLRACIWSSGRAGGFRSRPARRQIANACGGVPVPLCRLASPPLQPASMAISPPVSSTFRRTPAQPAGGGTRPRRQGFQITCSQYNRHYPIFMNAINILELAEDLATILRPTCRPTSRSSHDSLWRRWLRTLTSGCKSRRCQRPALP